MTKNHDSVLLRTLIKLYEFNGNQHHCVAFFDNEVKSPKFPFPPGVQDDIGAPEKRH